MVVGVTLGRLTLRGLAFILDLVGLVNLVLNLDELIIRRLAALSLLKLSFGVLKSGKLLGEHIGSLLISCLGVRNTLYVF